MKKYLIISLLMLVFSVAGVSAATTDFIADGNITISSVAHPGGGTTADLTIVSGSRAESWSYDGGSFRVTDPDATNPFTMTASGVSSIRVNNSASQEVACTDGSGSVQLPSAAGVYRVFPSSSSCAGAASTPSGGGSSGGGGGTTPPPVPPPALAPPPPPPPPPTAPTPTSVERAVIPGPSFLRLLTMGVRGNDVKQLQQFLNTDPDTNVAAAGPGSPGQETAFFGGLTKKAVGKFQLKHGIVSSAKDSGYGMVGPKTRAKLNELAARDGVATYPQTVEATQAQLNELRALLDQLFRAMSR